MEIFRGLFFPSLEFGQAQGGFDEIDEIAARPTVGPSEVVLVKIVAGLVESSREFLFLLGRQGLAGFDFSQDTVIGRSRLDGFFPLGHIFLLIDALAIGTDFHIGNGFEPFVGQPQFNQLAGTRAIRAGRSASPGGSSLERIGFRVIEVFVICCSWRSIPARSQ